MKEFETDKSLALFYRGDTTKKSMRAIQDLLREFGKLTGEKYFRYVGGRMTYKAAFDSFLIWKRKNKKVVRKPKFEFEEAPKS